MLRMTLGLGSTMRRMMRREERKRGEGEEDMGLAAASYY